MALSPRQVRDQIQTARKAGLLDDGPAWTLKGQAARTFVPDLGHDIQRSRRAEPTLEMGRRFPR